MCNTVSFIHFTKVCEIGNDEGKNSNVYLAKDDQLGDEIVIKQMEKIKFRPEEYFLESSMLYASKHPNIVEIQYASSDADFIYLAMPFYPKGSLNSLMKTRYLSIRESVKYSLDLLNGVSFIHSKGLLHLDIKPTNILLDKSGKAVLTDFGLSKYVNEYGIADQQKIYCQHVDPEYFQHSARTVQSDIYQIGLTMYRMCNGVNILQNQMDEQKILNMSDLSTAVQGGFFPDRKTFLPHIPKNYRKVILKALCLDPSQRYQSTIEIMNDLSMIDSNLDWIYTGNHLQPYFKKEGNYYYSIEICGNNTIITCLKTNMYTNRTTKIHKYCLKCSSRKGELDRQLKRIVGEIGKR